MENASKALIMAAGILIGVLILSLGLYLYITFSQRVNETEEIITSHQLAQYNSQYTVFTGRTNITIHQIITIANKAHENNLKYQDYADFEEYYEIKVNLLPKYANLDDKNSDDILDLLNKYTEVDNSTNNINIVEDETSNLVTTFTCTDIKYHNLSGRVSLITFKESRT